ncbi:MAG TPA: glycosyltransferase family 4 protein [Alphaproteobacteria bacterium]|nr:glycosyltransferase family 4 protein [Alphaproteobacteria bacterium]
MRIAFYAPLKPPDHPVPSGDRRLGRALVAALRSVGHDVVLASRLRSWEGAGDSARQRRIERSGAALAARLTQRYLRDPAHRPALWLTYHLYHKAPDWLGPAVAGALAIPYVVVEASLAGKQAQGRWARGFAASSAAIARADLLINLNGDDRAGLLAAGAERARVVPLAPFIETAIYARAKPARAELARLYGLEPARPWLLTVAMMRPGAKLASYRVLAEALSRIAERQWQLVVVGDGPARAEVAALLAPLGAGRVRYLGTLAATELPALYASADLYVWPAVHEAFGMAFLEAQAAGLPVVAGRERGVPEVVREGEAGLLAAAGDAGGFAAAMAALLDDPERRRAMGARARAIALAEHDIAPAAARLDAILGTLCKGQGP